MSFEKLNLIAPLLRAIADEGYVEPTPIQEQAIPHVAAGRDLLACAQTGTGKTAAFALPILQRLASVQRGKGRAPIRTLVLTPTRELAAQIGESFATYGRGLRISHAVIFGGVGQNPQVAALQRGIDILIATPGRLLDLAQQGYIDLKQLEIFVLDEADRMLDMGFLPDVRRVINMIPQKRQTLLFSATMPSDIAELASRILADPVRVAVTPVASTVDKIEQSVFFVSKTDKRALLEHVLTRPDADRVLVFTRTKHGANKVVRDLERARIGAEAIHGNKSQNARTRALSQFKNGTTRVLVATDIAARGIDVEGISHVVNYDLPEVPESYVHRIGRTARAGAAGIAVSFCAIEERTLLRDIERLIRMRLPVQNDGGPVSLQDGGSQSTTPIDPPRHNVSRQGVPSANRQGMPAPSAGRRRSWGPSGRRGTRPSQSAAR